MYLFVSDLYTEIVQTHLDFAWIYWQLVALLIDLTQQAWMILTVATKFNSAIIAFNNIL